MIVAFFGGTVLSDLFPPKQLVIRSATPNWYEVKGDHFHRNSYFKINGFPAVEMVYVDSHTVFIRFDPEHMPK